MDETTIADVLTRVGWDLGHREGSGFRTRCPIHKGDNVTAFSYDAEKWYCFAGCGGGGVRGLMQALSLDDSPPPSPALPREVTGMHFAGKQLPPPPRVSDRLSTLLREQMRFRRQEVEEIHRQCIAVLCQIDDQLATIADSYPDSVMPAEVEERWLALGESWTEAIQQLRTVHAELFVLSWASRIDAQVTFDPCWGGCYNTRDSRIAPDVMADVLTWLGQQDGPFRELVRKFLIAGPY